MISGDYQLMFQDYYTGQMITLGGDEDYCSVRFDGIGSADLRSAEREMPGEDGITFGYEFLGARKWTIEGSVKSGTNNYAASDSGDAWNALAMLMRAWDYNRARLQAREVVPLYFKRPGRELMRVYGRPERIDPDASKSYAGFVSYQASFRQSDPRFYSDVLQSTTLPLTQPYSGGLLYNDAMTALITPFATSSVTFRQGTLINNGDYNAPLVIKFKGPVVNPAVSLLNSSGAPIWTATLKTTVNTGQTVTIDTRQWNRSVTRQDGASYAGYLNSPPLSSLSLPPGAWEARFAGTSPDGTATCVIENRDTWSTP